MKVNCGKEYFTFRRYQWNEKGYTKRKRCTQEKTAKEN